MILVGDIGGTRTRLATAERRGDSWLISRIAQQPTQGAVEPMIRRYLDEAGGAPLAAAAFCGAGPVAPDGVIRLTNAEVLLDPGALARAAGLQTAILVNDFAAVAHAIPRLPPESLVSFGGGAAQDAPAVVLGPGTGLGVAILTGLGRDAAVIAGEGGHADLAPVDDEELVAWQKLRAAHGQVSAETVLCGPGLERLHVALNGEDRLMAPQIAEAAWRGEAAAARTIALFTRWLGRVAGNLALTAGARGGVYLAGGIIPRWGRRFDTVAFRRAFEDKPPYESWLARIPSLVVTHPEPALFGLARLAGPYTSSV